MTPSCWSPAAWMKPASARRTLCNCDPTGWSPPPEQQGLAAADLCQQTRQAIAHPPGELRLPADESQLRGAARLHRGSAGAAPDEQRHGQPIGGDFAQRVSREAGRRSRWANREGLPDRPESPANARKRRKLGMEALATVDRAMGRNNNQQRENPERRSGH